MSDTFLVGEQAAAERSSPAAAWRRRFAAAVTYLPHAATLLAVLVMAFVSGGYIFSSATPVVLAYGGVMLVWFWLAPKRLITARVYIVALVAFALFVLWTGASILWSIGPDLSWVAFDYAAAYLLVAWVASTAPAGRGQLRFVAYGFLLVAVAVAVYAYLGKVLPDVVKHAHQEARLNQPLGYYNVLALMMVMALPVALEVASRRTYHPAVRALAASAITLLSLAFFFAFSRGGFVALGVCCLVYFVLSTARLGGLLALVCGVAPAAATLLVVRGRSTLFNPTLDDALRTAQGHILLRWSLLALGVAFVLQLGVALAHRRVALGQRALRALGTTVVVLLLATIVVGGAEYFGPRGGVVHWVKQHYDMAMHDSTLSGAGNGPSRLFSLSTGRPGMWREGIKQFHLNPLAGTGAGTFRFTHDRFRVGEGVVKHAHSQWINVLSELGLIGLGLFVVSIGLLLAGMLRRLLRDRDDGERALLAGVQAACVAFVVHMSWDWDWDMAAITFAFLLLAGTAASYLGARGREPVAGRVDGDGDVAEPAEPAMVSETRAAAAAAAARRGRRFGPAARTLACGLVVLGGVSWTLPYFSERAFSRAVEQAGKQRLSAAVASARQAHRFNPLAVDPLITLAQVQQQLALAGDALQMLTRAQKLQPQNFEVYYQTALLLSTQFGRDHAAAAELRRGLALNPNDSSMLFLLSSIEHR